MRFELYKAGNNAIDYYFCYDTETELCICVDCDLNEKEIAELAKEVLSADTIEDVEKLYRVDNNGWLESDEAFEDLWDFKKIEIEWED